MKETQQRINEALRYIRHSNKSGSHVNCLRLHDNCSEAHNGKIIAIAKEFHKLNIPFITEAEFINGGRADLINLSTHEIYEVAKSESEESLANKLKKYPSIFKIIKIRI